MARQAGGRVGRAETRLVSFFIGAGPMGSGPCILSVFDSFDIKHFLRSISYPEGPSQFIHAVCAVCFFFELLQLLILISNKSPDNKYNLRSQGGCQVNDGCTLSVAKRRSFLVFPLHVDIAMRINIRLSFRLALARNRF
jgi:hypothetical protein